MKEMESLFLTTSSLFLVKLVLLVKQMIYETDLAYFSNICDEAL